MRRVLLECHNRARLMTADFFPYVTTLPQAEAGHTSGARASSAQVLLPKPSEVKDGG